MNGLISLQAVQFGENSNLTLPYRANRIILMRDRGVAVLLVSAELDEIMSLSDRIAVMYRGEIVATVNRKDATREQLGLLMAGVRETA